MARGHVVARSRDANGNVMGRSHTNAILYLRMYQVEFTGGESTELIANFIAESMYNQCDLKGNEYSILDVLVDYHRDNKDISLPDQQTTVWGRPITYKTNTGWQVFCQWKDGFTTWEKLSKLKESHPMQTVEFAVAQEIDHKPAFNWWIRHVLKKRDRIIASIR